MTSYCIETCVYFCRNIHIAEAVPHAKGQWLKNLCMDSHITITSDACQSSLVPVDLNVLLNQTTVVLRVTASPGSAPSRGSTSSAPTRSLPGHSWRGVGVQTARNHSQYNIYAS